MNKDIDELEFTCPECDTPFAIRMSRTKPGSTHTCTSCGVVFEFSGDDLTKLGKALTDLDDTLNLL